MALQRHGVRLTPIRCLSYFSVFCKRNIANSDQGARKLAKDSRVMYVSRRIIHGKASLVLCDLSSAQICVNDNHQHDLPLVPENHRLPELVILDMLWSYPVEMWCLGITVCDFFLLFQVFLFS